MIDHVARKATLSQRSPAFEVAKAALIALGDQDRAYVRAWTLMYIRRDGSLFRPSQAPAKTSRPPNLRPVLNR